MIEHTYAIMYSDGSVRCAWCSGNLDLSFAFCPKCGHKIKNEFTYDEVLNANTEEQLDALEMVTDYAGYEWDTHDY